MDLYNVQSKSHLCFVLNDSTGFKVRSHIWEAHWKAGLCCRA